MHPSFISVTSSNIEGYLYLAAKSTLLIAFKSGGTYAYDNVPQSVATGFGNAPSKGKFFQSDIKDRYTTSKLDDAAVTNLVSGNAASATSRPPRKKPRVSFESLIQRHPILSAVF
ncbi:KTSC domain-containing protein [Accumulibacter sp.]|jgi:lysyl-tRNA synthetase class 2|uniref:KTSC domain-containing protein n=1 Tax=Accumulibacter sp. TaxID=2053492 RepID=UPI0013A04300|nr:KTSC domain-containing protein [Accumulibacter sp.]KAB2914555.1 MAG: KTSC domain-containing protein [Dechloromonas sp.]